MKSSGRRREEFFRGNVWIWDLASGEEAHLIEGSGDPVKHLAFDQEGERLAIVYEHDRVRVWDLKNRESNDLDETANVSAVDFLSGGALILGTASGLVLWDGDHRSEVETKIGRVSSFAINISDQELAVATDDGRVHFLPLNQEGSKIGSGEAISIGNAANQIGSVGRGRWVVTTSNQGRANPDQSIRMIDRSSAGEPVAWTRGHVGRGLDVVFSPNGSRLVSLGSDRTTRVWDAAGGDALIRVPNTLVSVDCAAISLGSSTAVSGSRNGRLLLWDLKTLDATPVELTSVSSPIIGVCFNKEGNQLAFSTKGSIQLGQFSSASFEKKFELQIPEGEPSKKIEEFLSRELYFSSDGSLLIAPTSRGRILLLSTLDGELVSSIDEFENHRIWDFDVAKDADFLVANVDEYRAVVLDFRNPTEPVEVQSMVQNTMYSSVISPSGDLVVTGGYDPKVVVWNVASGQQIGQIEGHDANIEGLEFSPDGMRLASLSGGKLRLWEIAVPKFSVIYGSEIAGKAPWDDVRSMLFRFSFSPDERKMLIFGLWNGYRSVLLDRDSGQQQMFVGGHGGTFHPDGDRIVLSKKTGELDLIDLDSGQALPFEHDGREMKSVVFNSDGSLVAGAAVGDVIVWDTETRKRLCKVPAHSGNRSYVLFHPHDKHLLASSGADGKILLWDVSGEEPRRLRMLDGHQGSVRMLAFSHDGSRLASGGYHDSPAVILWDIESGRQINRFLGHTDRVTDVDISPDGKWVASASRDFTVRLWDAETGNELRRFQEAEDVFFVKFANNGSQIASVAGDGNIRFRDLKVNENLVHDRDQIAKTMGLRIDEDLIQPLPSEVRWNVESLSAD